MSHVPVVAGKNTRNAMGKLYRVETSEFLFELNYEQGTLINDFRSKHLKSQIVNPCFQSD